MKDERKATDTAEECEESERRIEAGYRRLYSIERELNAIPHEAWHGPEAEALRKELAFAAAEVLSREMLMDHRRRQVGPGPHLIGPPGTA